MALRDVQRRAPWVMAPVELLTFLVTPRRWVCLADRVAGWLMRALAPDTTGLAKFLGTLLRPFTRLRAFILARSAPLRAVDWWFRKCFWAILWGFAVGLQRWPRRANVPREEKPIRLLTAPETYPDFKAPSLVVPSQMPCAESSLVTDLSVQLTHLFQDLYPIVSTHQRDASTDPRERVRRAYPLLYRLVRRPPVWHQDLVEASARGNLLGALAVGGPFAKLLERADAPDRYVIDLAHMSAYPVRDGLCRVGCKIHFAAAGGCLSVTGIEYEGQTVAPGTRQWELTERIALAALVTHLTVWRQGMEYHVGGLAPVPVVTHNLLPPRHPVRRLLAPHLDQTMLTNYSTHLTLRRSGFDVHGFSFPFDSLLRYYDDGARAFDIRRLDVRADAVRRGIPEALDYPWLPQAGRYYDLFAAYARDYLACYYRDEAELRADRDLHVWFEALDRYVTNGVRGYVPELTREGLARLCTLLMYSPSVTHTENSLWNYAVFMPTTVRQDRRPQSVGEVQCVVNFQFLICSATSLLVNDFSHVALDETAGMVMTAFQDRVRDLQTEMEKQPGRYWHLYPNELEAGVSA
jgi:hypothetical protein